MWNLQPWQMCLHTSAAANQTKGTAGAKITLCTCCDSISILNSQLEDSGLLFNTFSLSVWKVLAGLSLPLSKEVVPSSESSLKDFWLPFFFSFPSNSKTFNPADNGHPRLLNPQQVGKQTQEEWSGLGHQEEKGGGNFPGLWQHQMSFHYSSLFLVLAKPFSEFPKNNTLA